MPVCRLLIFAVVSSDPVMITVESALTASEVKPAEQFHATNENKVTP